MAFGLTKGLVLEKTCPQSYIHTHIYYRYSTIKVMYLLRLLTVYLGITMSKRGYYGINEEAN
jgi:hypothetical protein